MFYILDVVLELLGGLEGEAASRCALSLQYYPTGFESGSFQLENASKTMKNDLRQAAQGGPLQRHGAEAQGEHPAGAGLRGRCDARTALHERHGHI